MTRYVIATEATLQPEEELVVRVDELHQPMLAKYITNRNLYSVDILSERYSYDEDAFMARVKVVKKVSSVLDLDPGYLFKLPLSEQTEERAYAAMLAPEVSANALMMVAPEYRSRRVIAAANHKRGPYKANMW